MGRKKYTIDYIKDYLLKYNITLLSTEYKDCKTPIDIMCENGHISSIRFDNFKRRDKIKTKYCIGNNIKLIRIPYWDFDNIEEILIQQLNLNNLDIKLK